MLYLNKIETFTMGTSTVIEPIQNVVFKCTKNDTNLIIVSIEPIQNVVFKSLKLSSILSVYLH